MPAIRWPPPRPTTRKAPMSWSSSTSRRRTRTGKSCSAWWLRRRSGSTCHSPWAAGRDAVDWAREATRLGAGEILLTSMDRDGTKDGYDLELTRAVSTAVSIPVIASGGAGTLEHLWEGLVDGSADAVLAASIFHFGLHTVAEAKAYLRERGVEVRLEP